MSFRCWSLDLKNRRIQLDLREWVNNTEEFLGYPQKTRTIKYAERQVGMTLDRPFSTPRGVERPPLL